MKKAGDGALGAEIIEVLNLNELSAFCHVEVDWVIALVDHGVIDPKGSRAEDWQFTPPSILRARKARRLSRDLGLNLEGVALVLDLLEERDALARKLAQFERSGAFH